MVKTAAEKAKPAAKKTPAVKPVAVKAASKTAPAAAPKKAVKPKEPKAAKESKDAAVAKDKARKIKLVRDSFTMPETEYKLIGDVKRDCLQAGIEVKKSELLRVGVALVRQMDVAKLKEAIAALPALKAGRPKKEK